jgi:hypothetical protein
MLHPHRAPTPEDVVKIRDNYFRVRGLPPLPRVQPPSVDTSKDWRDELAEARYGDGEPITPDHSLRESSPPSPIFCGSQPVNNPFSLLRRIKRARFEKRYGVSSFANTFVYPDGCIRYECAHNVRMYRNYLMVFKPSVWTQPEVVKPDKNWKREWRRAVRDGEVAVHSVYEKRRKTGGVSEDMGEDVHVDENGDENGEGRERVGLAPAKPSPPVGSTDT